MAGTPTRERVLWRRRIFICTYVGYAGYCLTRKVYSICKSSLHGQFDWDSQQLAHIWTVYLIAYSAGQFVNSYYRRRLGTRQIQVGRVFVFAPPKTWATSWQ